jgi:hypothetical protein
MNAQTIYKLEPGYQVFSSCRAETAGEVLRVGPDANGEPVVDLYVADLNEFMGGRWESTSDMMQVRALADYKEGKCCPLPGVFVDLQWKMSSQDYIELNTPGDGCHRCTSGFMLIAPGGEYYTPGYAATAKT